MTVNKADAAKQDEDKVFRLHDMLVQEVSLVDRAANKRTFLVCKRDENAEETGAELVSDGNGGFVQTAQKAEDSAEVADSDAPAQDSPPADSGEGSENVIKLDDAMKTSILRVMGEALEKMVKISTAVRDAPSDSGETGLAMSVVEDMSSVMGMLQGIAQRYMSDDEDMNKGDKGEPAPAPAAGGMLKALTHAASVLQPVEKAGRKMSKTRLEALRMAVKTLNNILADVDPDSFEMKTVDNSAKGNKGRKKTKKSDDAPAPEVAELTKKVEELSAEVRNTKAQNAKLAKSIGPSNSMLVEATSQKTFVEEDQPVVWSIDMNRPVTRETVGKGNWFSTEKEK